MNKYNSTKSVEHLYEMKMYAELVRIELLELPDKKLVG